MQRTNDLFDIAKQKYDMSNIREDILKDEAKDKALKQQIEQLKDLLEEQRKKLGSTDMQI